MQFVSDNLLIAYERQATRSSNISVPVSFFRCENESDSINTIEFDKYYSIIPNNQFVDEKKKKLFLKSGKKCKIGFSYNSLSNKNYLSVKQIRDLIIKNVPGSKKVL